MSECEAVFQPDKWRHERGTIPITEDRVPCPKDSLDNSDYCKYHSEPEYHEQTEEEVFLDLLSEDKDIFAPKFKSIDLNDREIGERSIHTSKLIHPIINDKLSICNCDFVNDFTIESGTIGHVNIIDVNTSIELSFSNCTIEGGFHFTGSNWSEEIKILNTDVWGDSYLKGVYDEEVDFSGSRFGGLININESEFRSNLIFKDCEFWTSIILNDVSVDEELRMDCILTDFLIHISDCNISNIHVFNEGNSDRLVRILRSELKKGRLLQQEKAKTLYDLSQSTLGDVRFEFTSNNVSDFYFNDTNYSDFDFTQMHNQLRNADWQLHNFSIDNKTVNSYIKEKISGPEAGKAHSLYDHTFEMRNNVETYIKAKERASRQGDSQSASQFLINEMRAKRKKRAHHLSTSTLRTREKWRLKLSQWKNKFLDITCGYGEQPWKAAAWAAGIPLISGFILYPLLGGVHETESGRQLTFDINGSLDPSIIIDVVGANLYFSILTFSTIGSSSYSPATFWSALLMAFESLLGPFFVALFVFTLGKQVTR
ncbi:potassium channel family protein [Natronorubrum bangense]|uniref:Two pore domain potassium channel family protein n=1 Tax=Natronorubrum bangense TaxID=61858 RepID=A0A4D6HP60_9EURY|nr:potassium channel family protein [Natronorubrum bangense]QCC55341.1 two pore domain potassium channel family protein [Natronorubrum bangense]